MNGKMIKYFFEIHKDLPREGPGSFEATKRAYDSIKEFLNKPLILDIGCGPGKQTIDLLNISDGEIIAIDNHRPFIERLNKTISDGRFEKRAKAQFGDMSKPEFEEGQFDLIWSEGAIYQLGFEKGLKDFRKYLKPGGFIAVTEAAGLREIFEREC
jgi:SAM-dependent methyltransferase